MRIKMLLLAGLCSLLLMVHAQSNIENRLSWGKGNNTFPPAFQQLQGYFMWPNMVRQFEHTLDHFERRWYASDTTRYADGRVVVTMPYLNVHGEDIENSEVLSASYDQKQRLTALHYMVVDDVGNSKIQTLGRQLKVAGFKIDDFYTKMTTVLRKGFTTLYFIHPVNHLAVSITDKGYWHYAVAITKS